MIPKNTQANRKIVLSFAALGSITLLAIGVLSDSDALWGINHLRFLGQGYWYVCGLASLVIILSLVMPRSFSWLEDQCLSDRATQLLESRRVRLVVAIFAGIIFWTMRIDTFLLGDGYAWLSILGRGENYIHKLTEPGSMIIIRNLQMVLGGYTQATSLLAFQVVSVFSGVVVFYNFLGLAVVITTNRVLRAMILITFLSSGLILLFLGYVEFYPILWAAATSFLYSALRYLKSGKGLWLVILTFVLSVLMHLQSLYFLPAVLYLILERFSRSFPKLRSRNIVLGLLVVVLFIGSVAFYWLYNNILEFEVIFLPFFEGRSTSPEYAIFSFAHIRDIFNLALLMFPGLLLLLTLRFLSTKTNNKPSQPGDPVTFFLGFCSVGSIVFLLMIDPVIGMARDWDLFSLTLLPPLLLLFINLNSSALKKVSCLVIPYAVVCVIGAGLFLAVNISTASSESRFHSILKGYGSKERSGWVIYSNYLKDIGEVNRQQQVLTEMARRFPEDESLKDFYKALARRDNKSALQLAKQLYGKDPYRADFLQALGNVYRRMKVFDSSNHYFKSAIRLKPYHSMLINEYGQSLIAQGRLDEALQQLNRAHYYEPTNSAIMEGIGLAYNNLGQFDSTLMIADSLFALDGDSPGGHLLKMVVLLQSGDRVSARRHFIEYKKHGSRRSDYRSILDYYGNLDKSEE